MTTQISDSTIIKIDSDFSPHGDQGQKYLASGKTVSMRLWEDVEPGAHEETSRDYETVGYVLRGRASLKIGGQTVALEEGDSWVVPKGARHSYEIFESFTAVEATSPPAQVHSRDQ